MPGYAGILGNETADVLAKKSVEEGTYTETRDHIQRLVPKEWSHFWTATNYNLSNGYNKKYKLSFNFPKTSS